MLQIGWSTKDITPDRPAMIQGQRNTRIGRKALDPLTVTAMAIEGGTPPDCAIMISCDLPFIEQSLLQAVREQACARLPSISPDRILMNATHTHTAMVLRDGVYDHPGGDVMLPSESHAVVAAIAAEAAVEAWNARTPMTVGRAFGHAVVGHNRLTVYADGHSKMYGKTNGPDFRYIGGYEDHSLDMLFMWKPDGKLAGTAISIPCPSQVTEGICEFSADFWHEIRVELRSRLGADLFVLPICAAAGDQSPHFLVYGREEEEMRKRRGLTERQKIGERVADAVMRALACTHPEPVEATTFAHVSKSIDLPPRKITREDRDWAQGMYDQWVVEHGENTSWSAQRRLAIVETFDGLREPEPYPIEIHILRIGDAVLATNPFELFLDYGIEMKARSPARQTILAQLTGWGWYLPSERSIQGGAYGANPEVSMVGPDGGRILVEETLAMINDLWEGEAK